MFVSVDYRDYCTNPFVVVADYRDYCTIPCGLRRGPIHDLLCILLHPGVISSVFVRRQKYESAG